MIKKIEKCFLACPIGEPLSDTRKHCDWLYETIYSSLSLLGIELKRADKISKSGLVTTQILEQVISTDLMIADLTFHNPNVFFELGWRYALRKPFVQIIKQGTTLPFDVGNVRTIFFDPYQPTNLQASISEFVMEINDKGFSPIYESLDKIYHVETGSPIWQSSRKFSKVSDDDWVKRNPLFFLKMVDHEGIFVYRENGKFVGFLNEETPHPLDIAAIDKREK